MELSEAKLERMIDELMWEKNITYHEAKRLILTNQTNLTKWGFRND
jgi:hypothetical protein